MTEREAAIEASTVGEDTATDDSEPPLLMSRSIQEGVTVTDADISVSPIVQQYGEMSFLDVGGLEEESATITSDTLQQTFDQETDGTHIGPVEYPYATRSLIDSGTSGKFAVKAEDSHIDSAVCTLSYAVVIEFTDEFGTTHSFRVVKSYRKQAESLKRRLEDRIAEGKLTCWYEDGSYHIGDEQPDYEGLGTALSMVLGSAAAHLLVGTGTATLLMLTAVSAFALVRTYQVVQTYRGRGYSGIWRASTESDDTVLVPELDEPYGSERGLTTVRRTHEQGMLRFEADEIDETWTFEYDDDGIVPEAVVRFYEDLGFSDADADTIRVTVSTEDADGYASLQSDSGEYFLIPDR